MSSAVGGRNPRMSPTLIGAIAVLIVVITTFLAYNANQGLPWVPSQQLTVEVKDAANIVPGNEVRIGGTRVGIVESDTPKRYPNGTVTALLGLKLDQGTEQLPTDTTVLIRARSLLGLKYVQLTPGKDKKTFAWGSSVPLANSTPDPVEIDQLLNTFDDKTRAGVQALTIAFGDAVAGRGSVLGQLIDDAGPVSENIVPVVKVLANDQDGLVPFLNALSRFTGELAAAGDSTGGLFRGLDRTFGALANADAALDQSLAIAPDALSSTAQSLAGARGAIGPHIQIAQDLQPSFKNVADSASDLAEADKAGVSGFRDVPRTATQFDAVLDQLDAVAKSDIVARGLDGVTQFSLSSQPLIEAFSRAQTVCSYPSILLRNIASATSDGDTLGNWLRAVPYLPPYVPNGEGGPATGPAVNAAPPAGAYAASSADSVKSSSAILATSGALFSNPSPVTGAGGVCQSGYETRRKPLQPATAAVVPVPGKVGNPTVQGTPFRPAPPKGSPFRPKSLDAASEDQG